MFKVFRNTFLILLLVSPFLCLGQKSRFKLLLTRACQTIEQLDTSYYLRTVGKDVKVFAPVNGIVTLPSPGRYLIEFSFGGPMPDSPFVDIVDTTLLTYHYKEPAIGLYRFDGFDGAPLYRKCGALLDGYQEDFYPKGGIKMRGTFKSGWVRDSIVTFYPNEKIKRSYIRLSKTVTVRDFDSLGNKTRLYKGENKSYMVYHEYTETYFYPNGQIRQTTSISNHIIRIEAYYPDGRLKKKLSKKKRLEYFPNGQLKYTYYWKDKTEDKKNESKTFLIYKKMYDENKTLLESAVYEEWGYIIQPNLNIDHSDWIVQYERYENGKKVFEISDVDTDEYKKQHTNALDENSYDDNP